MFVLFELILCHLPYSFNAYLANLYPSFTATFSTMLLNPFLTSFYLLTNITSPYHSCPLSLSCSPSYSISYFLSYSLSHSLSYFLSLVQLSHPKIVSVPLGLDSHIASEISKQGDEALNSGKK